MLINQSKLQECSDRVIVFLHDCWTHIHDNTVEKMQPDPFYSRNDVLTPEIVEKVAIDIEGIFKTELTKYMSYHRNAQGVSTSQELVAPGFDQLPYHAKRYVCIGMDRILQDYRIEAPETPPPSPYDPGNDPYYYD